MARGNRHLPTADVRNFARGRDARVAGVYGMRGGIGARVAGVMYFARGNRRLSYGLLIFNDGAPDDDVAVVEGDDLARCDGVDGCMALNR